jgi:hypothetical protein
VSLSDALIYYTSGDQYSSPDLPDNVSVSVPDEGYNISRQLAVKHPINDPSAVEIRGIVRGTDSDPSPGDTFYTNIPTKKPKLSVETTTNDKSSFVNLNISLTSPTGEPITTALTKDEIQVAGKTVETDADGEATVTLRRSQLPVLVWYEPTYFWDRGEIAYAETHTRVSSQPTVALTSMVQAIVKLISILIFFWSPFYILDKAYSGDYWPPWRGIFR